MWLTVWLNINVVEKLKLAYSTWRIPELELLLKTVTQVTGYNDRLFQRHLTQTFSPAAPRGP